MQIRGVGNLSRLKRNAAVGVVIAVLAALAPPVAWGGNGPAVRQRIDDAVAVAAGVSKVERAAKSRVVPLDQDAAGRVVVYVEGAGARRAVEAAGGVVSAASGQQVRAVVPRGKLLELAGEVDRVRRPDKPVPMEIISEGAHLMGAPAWHADGRQGAGVKVGIIDAGFGGLDAAKAAGELPTDVTVNPGQCSATQSSHGTTVAEVVHDVAPAAQLFLACVTDSMGFEEAARWLSSQGVTVVNVSLGFPGTGRGDGLPHPNALPWNPATVVAWLRSENISVVSAAGNEAQKHWSGLTADQNTNGWVNISGAAEAQSFSVPARSTARLDLQWDAWPRTQHDLDLYVMSQAVAPTGPNDPNLVTSSINAQKDTPAGLPPTEGVELRNDSDEPKIYWAYVKTHTADRTLRYDLTGYGRASGFAFQSAAGSVVEPATSPFTLAVGAIQPANSAAGAVESYSSRGPTVDGRVKPDLVAYSNVSSSTPCTSVNSNQCGTSVAAAHVTGAAALYRAANPDLDSAELDSLLLDNAKRPGRSNELGYGVIALGASRVPAVPAGSGFTVEQSPRRLLSGVELAAGETRTIAFPGLAEGATAVALGVHGANPADQTELQVYGVGPTEASTVGILPGRSNQVMTAVTLDPVDKVVRVRNTSASVTVTVDLLGTFSPAAPATYFGLQQPLKVMDTRTWGTASPKLGDAEVHRLRIRGTAGVPSTATAALVNVTGVDASAAATLDLYGNNWPNVGTLTSLPGDQQTKLTVVPIGDDGAIRIRGRGGEQHVAVDLVGWFAPGAGAKYVPLRYSERVYDTQRGTNSVPIALAAGQLREFRVTRQQRVPADASAVWTSIRATSRTRAPMSISVASREFPSRGQTGLSVQWYNQSGRPIGSSQHNNAVTPLGVTGVMGFRSDAATEAADPAPATPHLTVALQGYFVGGAPVAPAAQPVPAAHWKLDEASGTTGADASGNGHNAGFEGAAGWTGGRAGRGAWLDGATAYGRTAGPVIRTDQSFSVAAWVYKTSTAASAVTGQDGTKVSGFFLESQSGRWSFSAVAQDAVSNAARAHDARPSRVGEWSHLVGVYDAEAHQLRLYVNGALAATADGVTLWRADGAFTIGAALWDQKRAGYFDKGIDEVRAYQQALTESEVRDLHASAPAVTWGSWAFDEGTGTTAQDASWRNWDGALQGSATWGPGHSGSAVKLNGTTSWVSLPARADLAVDSFTVSAWVNPTATGPRTALAQDGPTNSPFVLQLSGDRWTFGPPDGRSAISAAQQVVNRWTHLAGVYDAAARQVRLYVDGKLAGTSDGITLTAGNGVFTVGRAKSAGQPVNYFAGSIDSVEISQGVKTDAQLRALAAG